MNQQNIQPTKGVISAHLQSGNFADAAAVWQQQTDAWKASDTGVKAFRSITTKAREQMTALLAVGNLDGALGLWSVLPEEMRNDPDMQQYHSEQLLTAYNDPVEMESRRAAAAQEQQRLQTIERRAQTEQQRVAAREQMTALLAIGDLDGALGLWDTLPKEMANDPDMKAYYEAEFMTAYTNPEEMESRRAAEAERQAAAAKEQRKLETNATRAQVEAQRAVKKSTERGGIGILRSRMSPEALAEEAAEKAAAEAAQRRATNPTLEDLADGFVPEQAYGQRAPRDVSRGRR